MQPVLSALSRAFAQLGDRAIVAVLIKSVLLTLLLFALAGVALAYGLERAIRAQTGDLSAEIGAVIALVVTIIGGWVLFRIVALAVIQFFADEVVLAVERRYYPLALKHARNVPFREELGHSLRGILRALLVNAGALLVAIPLALTAIGPAVVFWLANSWLLGRELQHIAWIRHAGPDASDPPLSALQRFVLGGLVTGLLAIPFVNLLAPVIGTASAAHLVHGVKARQEAARQEAARQKRS